jgi:hypothetical protein
MRVTRLGTRRTNDAPCHASRPAAKRALGDVGLRVSKRARWPIRSATVGEIAGLSVTRCRSAHGDDSLAFDRSGVRRQSARVSEPLESDVVSGTVVSVPASVPVSAPVSTPLSATVPPMQTENVLVDPSSCTN